MPVSFERDYILDQAKKNAAVSQQTKQIKPFGTIYVRIVDAVPTS